MKKTFLLFVSILVLCLCSTSNTLATEADGWASENGGTTGGAGGTIVTVTTAADLKTYTEASEPYIIKVLGTLDLASIGGSVNIKSDKTISGIGTLPTIIGKLAFEYGASNIIIEKLIITNPYAGDPYDGISVKSMVTNLFITQCSVHNCGDGCIDITEGSDFVTVSWCKFFYDTRAPDINHRFVNLIGASDVSPIDEGRLRVTMHHNWWSSGCNQRMPRVRFGQVHIYNNYYSCRKSSYCAGAALESQLLIENNYFDNVRYPYYPFYYGGDPNIIIGKIEAGGNVFVNCSWWDDGNDDVFEPPYPYALDNGSDVKDIVMSGAGAPVCYGDFVELGIVNKKDLEYFLDKWLATDSNLIGEADFYTDGIINFREFALFAENWIYVPPDDIPPEEPTGLTATSGDGTVSLEWDDNEEEDLAGYNVYRSQTSGSGYSKLNSSLLTNANYTDYNVVNEMVYFYAVSAVDITGNTLGYSNEVWAIPLGAGSIVIQENETGDCIGDGTIYAVYAGYTGDGYYRTILAVGKGLEWSISVPSDGTYTLKWRYALLSGSRPARLLINGEEAISSISFPSTGNWANWQTVSQEVSLTTAGTKHIRLESTTSSGLANIDYIMITGDNPSPASCP